MKEPCSVVENDGLRYAWCRWLGVFNVDSHYYTPAKKYQPVIMRDTVKPLPELK